MKYEVGERGLRGSGSNAASGGGTRVRPPALRHSSGEVSIAFAAVAVYVVVDD